MSDSNPDEPAAQAPQPMISRRGLMKAGAAGGAAAVAGGAGGLVPDDYSPIGDAQAVPWLAVGGVAATGWLLREYEVLGSDDPPEGMTADSLRQRVYETAQTRKSQTESDFVDNENLIEYAKNDIYSEGKLAAIEALNDQESQSNVQSAALSAAESSMATIESNFLKGWRESGRELDSLITAVSDHPDLSTSDVIPNSSGVSVYTDYSTSGVISTSVTLRDGTTMDIPYVTRTHENGTDEITWNPTQTSGSIDPRVGVYNPADDTHINYLSHSGWNDVWTTMQTAFDDVNDGLITWVENVYDQVQSGEFETSELLTPSELAQLQSDDQETYSQAVADLTALNVPVNTEREAEILLTETNTTLYGTLGVSDETTLQSGSTVTPSSDDTDYWLSYNVAEAHGSWEAFEEGVDGGLVTFTEEPLTDAVWSITTSAQETAEVNTDDFSETDSGGTWEVDISDQVETAITNVNEVNFYAADTEEDQMETMLLSQEFEIVAFTNSDGEEVGDADYSSPTQAESDDNYITQEEWEEREQEYQDQIEDYEESTSGGGGLPSFGNFNPMSMLGGVIVIGGIGAAILGLSNRDSN